MANSLPRPTLGDNTTKQALARKGTGYETPITSLSPQHCRRFHSCSAPICPLEATPLRRTYRDGETICLYLLEAMKFGSPTRFRGTPEEQVYLKVVGSLESIITHCVAPLRKRLKRARKTGSRRNPGLRSRLSGGAQ